MLGVLTVAVTLPVIASAQSSYAGCQLFPGNHVFNTRIDSLPVHPNSAAYIAALGAGPAHPDWGSATPGEYYVNTVHGNSTPAATVNINWPFTSDTGPFPIPSNAIIGQSSDAHLTVLDVDNCLLYEAFSTTHNADGSWTVNAISKFDLSSDALKPADWSSSNAAGTAQLPLLVTYDEVAAGQINHAISMTGTPTLNSYVWPASHSASSSTTGPPMGTRFRLKASYNISSLAPQAQVVAQALKTYGAILTDNGASFFLLGLGDPRFSDDDLHTLTTIPGSAFEAVDESSLEISATSGQVPTASTLPSQAYQFVPITPCRIADTRNSNGAFGGPELAGSATREFVIPSSACSIPSNAAAYSLNVTVVPNGPLGYLTVWPSGHPQPMVSTLNSDGRVKANAAIVPAGPDGGINVFATDPTQLVLDINGYFVPASTSTMAFYPVTPCRVVDTRGAAGALGGPSLSAGVARAFPVLSSSCSLPSNAAAYSMNVTAVPHGALAYLTAWPAGQTQPTASTLNAPTGTVTANAAIVPAGSAGAISVYATNATDLVVDVDGYFAPAGTGGLSLYTLTPCRALDTRSSSGQFSGTLRDNIAGSGCGVPPSTAQAFVLNATVVPGGSLGYITLWPDGTSQPVASTLNASDGAIDSNMAIVPTTNGFIDSFASNPTQLILDVSGFFAP